MLKTYLSCDSFDQISIGDIERSAHGMSLRFIRTPSSLSLASSGIAFERPPAPTSCINSMMLGFLLLQVLITSWHRLSISALSLCTEAKSKSSSLCPDDIDDAAPPPRPISIDGPPKTITK